MMQLSNSKEWKINYLAQRKFPIPMKAMDMIRRYPLAETSELDMIFAAGDDNYAKIQEYKTTLENMTEQKLQKLYDKELKKEAAQEEAAQFYNQPESQADFDYWSKMQHWTIEEAIALSFGKDPEKVYWNRISEKRYKSAFVKEYEKLKKLTERAITWKKLFNPVLPTIFIKWANDSEIAFPKELQSLVEKRQGAWFDWKTAYDNLKVNYSKSIQERETSLKSYSENLSKAHEIIDQYKKALELKTENTITPEPEKPLHKKERDTMLKLIAGLLALNYNHTSIKNDITKAKQICDDILRDAGIEINDDTIRKYLREAQAFLPDNLDEQN